MISYKDYMCLVSQEDDPYTRAVTSLPRKAKKTTRKLPITIKPSSQILWISSRSFLRIC